MKSYIFKFIGSNQVTKSNNNKKNRKAQPNTFN